MDSCKVRTTEVQLGASSTSKILILQDLVHKIYLLHFSIDNDRRQENIVVKALIKENVIEKIASCELDFMS